MNTPEYVRWVVYLGGTRAPINAPPIDSLSTARSYAADISGSIGNDTTVSVLGFTAPAADRTFVGKVLADFRNGDEVPVPEDA
jgi:hypothetical protein